MKEKEMTPEEISNMKKLETKARDIIAKEDAKAANELSKEHQNKEQEKQ